MKPARNLKPHHFTWPALFSFLALTFYPLPLWPEESSLESASFRLREKPIEVPSDEASSDFTQDRNLILWQNVLTQELAHRFGSFLTKAAGNPLGMLGRALAHWGVFFDADFSPLDGNDWVDNGNGTFTLKRSYIDEAAFKRSLTKMPYNDLDLYTMGLLDPTKVQPTFVIENPTLQDGRALRPHGNNPANSQDAGPYVDIQNPDGTWSGPYYLPSDFVVKGTRKSITLSDITALEGNRDPAPSLSQKDFKTAFITLTNEGESSLDTLEMTQKINRFKDSFLRFFQDMARNLGGLLFPKGETAGSAPIGASSTSSSVVSSLRSTALSGGEAISGPLFSHPFGDSGIEPFEPLDFTHLKPIGFEASLEKLLPESYSLDTLKASLASAFLSPLNLFGALLPKENLFRALGKTPSLATSPLSLGPSVLNDSLQLETLNLKLETPLLYSDWKREQMKPFRFTFPDPNASPLPLLDSSFPQGINPSPSFQGRGPAPQANPTPPRNPAPSPNPSPSPEVSRPNPPAPSVDPISARGGSGPSFGGRNSQSSSYTPLIWDALAPRYREDGISKFTGKKPKAVSQRKHEAKRDFPS